MKGQTTMTEPADVFSRHQVPVSGGSLHAVAAGPTSAPAIVLLHGWPQPWQAFAHVMCLAAQDNHVVALDLPGIGKSNVAWSPGDKVATASLVREALTALGL